MTSVFGGVPDPDPVAPGPSDSSSKGVFDTFKRRKLADGRRNVAGGAVSPPQPQIATPAPAGVESDVPAGDVEEGLNRSTWTDVRDAEDAELTILRALNVWLLAYRRLTEQWLVDEVRLLLAAEAARARARRATALADERTAAFKAETDPKKARRMRRDAVMARRVGQEAEARAGRIETRARAVTSMIDSTPVRVHDEIAVVIAHFWLNYHRRALGKHNLKGTYETPEAREAASRVDFQQRFRKINVPSATAIAELIADHRAMLRPPSLQPRPGAHDAETGNPAATSNVAETTVDEPVMAADDLGAPSPEHPKPQLVETGDQANGDEAAA